MDNDVSNDPLTLQSSTLNPYRTAAGMLARRLVWDMYPHSWISRYRIKSWKNKFPGRKAVILCNGPSLLKSDFSALEGVFTFGLNKINLLFDENEFRPSCIVSVNPFVIEQTAEFYNETNIPLFIDSYGARQKIINMRPNVAFLHSGHQGFAKDCSISIYQGYTVTYVAMQLAFHMGFHDVALVGCDHNFSDSGPANKTVISGDTDNNHFHPSYFSGGVKWQLPDLFESEIAYVRAKKFYEAAGRRLVNCTSGGQLEVFERMDLKTFID